MEALVEWRRIIAARRRCSWTQNVDTPRTRVKRSASSKQLADRHRDAIGRVGEFRKIGVVVRVTISRADQPIARELAASNRTQFAEALIGAGRPIVAT